MASNKGSAPTRGPGRPRKWADDAERLRAYRARRAEELAEPERLRSERRELQRRVAQLERELDAEQKARSKAERALDEAQAIIRALRERRPSLFVEPAGAFSPPPPALRNRAQRRAADRRRRHQK
ncbi:MAG TPA: hypothetical protein VGB14_18825 [Acidimicrobiales bacterium]